MRPGPIRLVLALVVAGLLTQSGGVMADPWGIAVGPVPEPRWGGNPSTLNAPGGAGILDAPVVPPSGWRFRGDATPSSRGGIAGGGEDQGPYRFRPLTERESMRQGAGADRPVPGDGVGSVPPAMGPVWPTGVPDGYGAGPWSP